MKTRLATILGIALASLALPAAGRAQSGADILQKAMKAYEQRIAGIDNYTVTYSFMGQDISNRFEKKTVNGHPVFVPAGKDSSEQGWSAAMARFPELAARASYKGDETVDGHPTHVLEIDDLSGMDLGTPPQSQGSYEPKSMTLWLDSDQDLVRKMKIDGEMTANGKTRPATMTALLTDYRTVEGFPYPWTTQVSMEGVMGDSDVSPEDRQKAKESLEKLDEQMKDMPEQQRKMMEKMMGPQLESLRKMVESGTFQMSLTVKDLEVNTPPPTS